MRALDHDIKPGVKTAPREDNAWPLLRETILAGDVLVLATPIWMGQRSSVVKRMLARMDAFLGEVDKQGRCPPSAAWRWSPWWQRGRRASCDCRTPHVLANVEVTIPGGSSACRVGEATGNVNYVDLDRTPKPLANTSKTQASAAALQAIWSGC